MVWLFFLFGLGSLTGQILLLREILVIFHGTEISIGVFYGSWLAGIALGAAVGSWVTQRRPDDLTDLFLYSLVGLGFSILFQITIIRMVPAIFGAAPAELAPLSGILAAAPAGTLTAAFLTGFLFPVGCRSVIGADDRLIARLYVFEALGGLAGGLILTFFLLSVLEPLRIAALTAAVIGSAVIVSGLFSGRRSALVGGPVLLLAAVALLLPAGTRLIDWSVAARWNALHPGMELLTSKPTPYQQAEIARLGKQISFFGNGSIVASFPDPHTADRLTALITAQNPRAKRFLVIGGGIGSFLTSLLSYPVSRVDLVEPDPWAFRIVRDHLPERERNSLEDPRVHPIFRDGRLYLNRLHEPTYDVVVAMLPDPVSAFWNRYYTLEFFQAVSRALNPRGILVTEVTSAENFWGPEVASYAGSVYHTLLRVFPSVKGTPGDKTIFFASVDPGVLSMDPEVLKARYAEFSRRRFDPSGFDTLLPPRRTRFTALRLEQSPVLINTDFRPVSTSLAMILWGRFSGTDRMEVLNTLRRGGILVYLIPLGLFLLARLTFRARWGPRGTREGRFRAILAMTAVGAAAMGLQIVLIYTYQSLFGYVFERIGLFAGFFMTGLVAGGLAARRRLPRIRSKETAITVLLVVFAGICLVLPTCMESLSGKPPLLIEATLFLIVFLSGIPTGAVFPLVASRYLGLSQDAGRASGLTDAADHCGAAVGAAITGTLLVPLLGMRDACFLLAMFLFAPVLLTAAEFTFERMDPTLEPLRARLRPSFPFVRTSWFLIFTVAAAFTWRVLIGPPVSPPVVKFSPSTLEKVSGSTEFTFEEKPFPHYIGKRADLRGKTISLSTFPAAGDVRGYGGPVNLLVSVDDGGRILRVKIVESKETPAYLHGIDPWLKRLKGRSILGPLNREVDALTGATITCDAVLKILTKTGNKIRGPLLGLPPVPAPGSRSHGPWTAVRDLRAWLIAGLMVLFLAAFHRRSRILRLVCLGLSLAVIGVFLNAPFTSSDAARLLVGGIPAADTLWRIVLLGCILGMSVLWGQAFCGMICPFGALQEFINSTALRKRASPRVERAGRYVKFVLLAVLLSLFLVTDDLVWFSFSPLLHFFKFDMGRWVLALSVTVLVASIFHFRFWCRYLCPAGAFLALFNKIGLLRRYAPRPVPARCDLGVTSSHDLDCIHCHRCLFEARRRKGDAH
jgi:spermidine synthase